MPRADDLAPKLLAVLPSAPTAVPPRLPTAAEPPSIRDPMTATPRVAGSVTAQEVAAPDHVSGLPADDVPDDCTNDVTSDLPGDVTPAADCDDDAVPPRPIAPDRNAAWSLRGRGFAPSGGPALGRDRLQRRFLDRSSRRFG